jgi:hypothetical protein
MVVFAILENADFLVFSRAPLTVLPAASTSRRSCVASCVSRSEIDCSGLIWGRERSCNGCEECRDELVRPSLARTRSAAVSTYNA